MPQELARIAIGLPGMESLAPHLPDLFANLSIGRAQIAAEQIRSSILGSEGAKSQRRDSAQRGDELVTVTARLGDRPVAAAIAIHPHDPQTGRPSDTATVVHAGWLGNIPLQPGKAASAAADISPGVDSVTVAVIAELGAALDHQLRRRGARFLQWATDVVESTDVSDGSGGPDGGDGVSHWCEGFGFEPLATLDYLTGNVPAADPAPTGSLTAGSLTAGSLRFEPLDWSHPGGNRTRGDDGAGSSWEFARLVDQTYQHTRDCPRLAQYRTAEETLHSYQNAAAFDRGLWYTVHAAGDDQPIGCLILANHRGGAGSTAPAMIELVYMGLVPAARRRGWGQQLVAQAFRAAADLTADRMMVAVDQQNHAARHLYRAAGLDWMLSETVWGKQLSSS